MAIAFFPLLCIAMFVLLMLAAVIAMIVVFIKAASGTAYAPPHLSTQRVPTQRGTFAAAFGATLGVLLLGSLFLGVTYPVVRHDVARPATVVHEMMPSVAVPPALPLPSMPVSAPSMPVSAVDAVAAAQTPLNPMPSTEPPTADRTTVESATPAGPPDWLEKGNQTNGLIQTVVISSKQYATKAEAEADADRQAIDLLRNDLRRYTSRTWVRPDEIIGLQDSLQVGIKDKYFETVQRDFGSFFAPMHRVWYRVELSPAVREPALIRWRAALVSTRTVAAGGAFLALLCVPLAVVAFSRCNRWTAGKVRTPLALGMTTAVLAAWIAGAVLFQRFFVLWG